MNFINTNTVDKNKFNSNGDSNSPHHKTSINNATILTTNTSSSKNKNSKKKSKLRRKGLPP